MGVLRGVGLKGQRPRRREMTGAAGSRADEGSEWMGEAPVLQTGPPDRPMRMGRRVDRRNTDGHRAGSTGKGKCCFLKPRSVLLPKA